LTADAKSTKVWYASAKIKINNKRRPTREKENSIHWH
jgi:hypothetical protein